MRWETNRQGWLPGSPTAVQAGRQPGLGVSRSVLPESVPPQGLSPTRLLRPWDFPGKRTGVDGCFLLQGICPSQGLSPHLLHSLHWEVDSFLLKPGARE